MQILYGKQYHRKATNPIAQGFQPQDSQRCIKAVGKFLENPQKKGLNCERLGSGVNQNHYSIRASDDLRVILALEPDHINPRRVGLINMGHHDDMYDWSKRRGYYTDLDEYGLVAAHPQVTPPENAALPPKGFAEWMLYLPKQQRGLVNRYYEAGVARIRGAAGTGKSVVALHRAVVLGRRYPDEKILVTTFSRSLCEHMSKIFHRMPNSPSNVCFVNIDSIAPEFDKRSLKFKAVKDAFEEAYRDTIKPESMAKLDREYMREEVRRIIKGRDASEEEYLDTGRFERIGRGRKKSFKKAERKIAWNLRKAWDREMELRETIDFPDRLIEARNQARKLSSPRYRAAVIDEAQDMTQVGIEFVLALIQGQPQSKLQTDSILILDDAAQRIYPGGWKPDWVNFKFTSENTDFLRVNFRNTCRIFQVARKVRGEKIVGKITNDDGTVADLKFERNEGNRPVMAVVPSKESRVILELIENLVNNERIAYNEIGVLVMRPHDAHSLVQLFEKRNIPCFNLEELTKRTKRAAVDGIRIGTFDRAKGMEFRAVLIARLGKSRFPLDGKHREMEQLNQAESGEEERERDDEQRQLNLDRLYVAMTRARERLYLIADEQPCEEIESVRNRFFKEYRPGEL